MGRIAVSKQPFQQILAQISPFPIETQAFCHQRLAEFWLIGLDGTAIARWLDSEQGVYAHQRMVV